MSAYVVDTNVAVVANGRQTHAPLECQLSCIDALRNIIENSMIVIDDLMVIMREYQHNLNLRGQPGVGDEFFRWAWNNQAVPQRCEKVTITPSNETGYAEFPDNMELAAFDWDDRVFVATALTSQNNPSILDAVDSDWWDYREPLQAEGVTLFFLCPAVFTLA